MTLETAPAQLTETQAHYMSKAAHSLVNVLTALDYSKFDLEHAARITARIHGLINYIDALSGQDEYPTFPVTRPDGRTVQVTVPGREA